MDKVSALAIDIGASGGKAIVGTLDLKEMRLTVDEIYRFWNGMIRVGNHLHWDILRIWEEVKNSIKLAYRKFKGSLVSIGVDTWGVDFALLDANGELVGLPYAYRDPMTEGVMDEVFRIIPRDYIYMRTGIQFMRINTIYQLYAISRQSPSKLREAKALLMIPDLINYWLTGVKVSEYTDASTTQLLDPRRREWCVDILEKLNIPVEIFQRVVDAGAVLGGLTEGLADELGIPKGELKNISVVAPATHDTASAVAAAPMVSESVAYISSGTWNLVGVELTEPLINEEAMRSNFTNEGGAFGKITFLRNMQGMWLIQEVRRILADVEGREYSYDELAKIAEEADYIGSVINVDDERFLAPVNMVEEINRYLEETGQRKPGSLGELLKVIIVSLALKHRYILEEASRLTGRRLSGVNIFGGGSRNSLMDQLTADVMGIPVYAGPEESTSLGNILVQLAGLGFVKSHEELRGIVRNSARIRVYEPRPSRWLEDAYSHFLNKVLKVP